MSLKESIWKESGVTAPTALVQVPSGGLSTGHSHCLLARTSSPMLVARFPRTPVPKLAPARSVDLVARPMRSKQNS